MDSNYYLEFENKFRGEREKIFNLFRSYEPLIDIVIANDSSPSLLDIGCGRGEWLELCKTKFEESIGIESDYSMLKMCLDNGLNVIDGDAVEKISEFESASISVITIFHLIEHLEYNQLRRLIYECQRVLKDDGVLIMETPSIDNLIVSTKLFYIDPTHINPINPDFISFHLEKAGFSFIKNFYINGGPLQDADPLKITRILNGVSQDLCIIALKSEDTFNKLFKDNIEWQKYLNVGLTTFQAAIDYDTKMQLLTKKYDKVNHEKASFKEEILFLKEEIILLKSQLKYFLYLLKILKFFFRPIFLLLKLVKKIIFTIFNKIFNIFFNHQIIRDFLLSHKFLVIIRFFLNILLGDSPNTKAILIQNKFKKILDSNEKFLRYNKKLLSHYDNSSKSKYYKKLFTLKNK
mgnify:CR=1 FL=1|tara:strand:+ start:8600 stop:9817 length:1218 start_codon:yes stop_codon:yes gene_type:complete